MAALNDYQRRRIISIWTQSEEKATFTELERVLAREGILTTCQTIKATIDRWQKTGSVRDCPRSGPPRKVPEEHYRCIDDVMAENDELTASDLKSILWCRFGADEVLYTVRTVARLRNNLGWAYTTDKHCQEIWDGNKAKRLEWCNKRMEGKEAFDDVIFTDESTVQLECHLWKCFRKR